MTDMSQKDMPYADRLLKKIKWKDLSPKTEKSTDEDNFLNSSNVARKNESFKRRSSLQVKSPMNEEGLVD